MDDMTRNEAIAWAVKEFGSEGWATQLNGRFMVGEIKDQDGGFTPAGIGDSYRDAIANYRETNKAFLG